MSSRLGRFTPEKLPEYSYNKRLGGPQSPAGRFREETNYCPYMDRKPVSFETFKPSHGSINLQFSYTQIWIQCNAYCVFPRQGSLSLSGGLTATYLRNISWQSSRLNIIYSDSWLKFKNLLHFTCPLNIICAVCRYANNENKNIKLANLFWITDRILFRQYFAHSKHKDWRL